MRKLNHANICRYRGVCIASPRLSLLYEFLENGTLGDRLRNKRTQNRAANGIGQPPVGGNGRGACGSANYSAMGTVNGCGSNCDDGSGYGGPCGRSLAAAEAEAAASLSLHAAAGRPPLGSADALRIVEEVVDGMQYLHEVRRPAAGVGF